MPETPKWIADIIDSVVIPPPPMFKRYCAMCGVEHEVPYEMSGRVAFCKRCIVKYQEYCDYKSYGPAIHLVQVNALDKAVFVYDSYTGERITECTP